MTKVFTYSLKQIILTAVLLLVAFSPFVQLASTAQAQTAGAEQTSTSASGSGSTPTAPAAAPAAPAGPQKPGTTDNIGCDFATFVGNAGGTFALCLTNIVYVFTVGIGSGFAYVAAYFFDWAIQISLNSASYALTFITNGWTTARDIANMAFLFILLYIAFKVMFQADTVGTIEMLAWVIIIALLVNFSFFFTRVVIDAGNILSIQFYNAIQAPSIATTASNAGSISSSANASLLNNALGSGNSKDLTASIMGMLQLTNLFNTNSFTAFFQSGSAGFLVTTIALSFLYIAAAIMFWLLTVAFVANGVKFLMRVVVLWFLIIASPLAFVARAIPKFEDYYWQWQDALIKHAFYPVAFMFIFLILSNFASQMSQSNGLINGVFNSITPSSGATATTAVAAIGFAAANIFIRLGFVLGVLYVGLEASNKIGVMGAASAKQAGNWVSGRFTGAFKKTGNLAALGAGAAYSRGVGSRLYNASESLKNTRLGNTALGYRLRKSVLEPAAATTFGGTRSYTDLTKARHEKDTDKENERRDLENRKKVAEVGKIIEANVKAGHPPEQGVNARDMERVQNLNKRELQAMADNNLSQLKVIAPLLTEGQKKTVDELSAVSDKDKEEIRVNWETNSKGSSLRSAQSEIKTLREIRDELRASRVTLAAVDTHTTAGATMNSAAIKAMKDNLVENLADSRQLARDGGRSHTDRKEAEQNAIKIQEAINKVEKLEGHMKKVGAELGNRADAKEFEVE